HDIEQVDEEPREPRQIAGKLEAADVSHCAVAANGSKATLIPIMKRLDLLPFKPLCDGAGGIRSHLDRRGGDAGNQAAIILRHPRQIADNYDFGMSRNRKVLFDL